MEVLKRITGVLGIIVFVFGILSYLFTLSFSIFVKIHFILALALISIYIFYNSSKLKELFVQRTFKKGVPTLIYVVLVAGIIVILNIILNKHYLRWDLTEASVHSLSDQSIKILNMIDKDIKIYGFVKDEGRNRISNLLDMYTYASKKIKYSIIDPEKRPDLAEKFAVEQYGTIVIEKDSQWVKVNEATEESITNAIRRVLAKEAKIIYFLEGHGERDILDQSGAKGFGLAKRALEDENYKIKKLFLPESKTVPADCSLLVIVSPEKEILNEEISAIEEYLNKGGSVLLLVDPGVQSSLLRYFEKWGIRVGDDIIIDRILRLFAGPALGVDIVVNTFEDHPSVRGLRGRVLLSMARSVDVKSSSGDSMDARVVAKTSPSSWADRDVRGVFERGQARFEKGDLKGPVPVAVAVEKSLQNGKKTRIVCIGDSDFASNRYISLFFNRDFFINICNWLLSEEEFISIRPKTLRASHIDLTQTQGDILFYTSVLFLPEIFLIAGIFVWYSRR